MTRMQVIAAQTAIGTLTATIGFVATSSIGPAGLLLGFILWLTTQILIH